ncbi:MAG TPA: amidohydrolase family protein [Rhodanobacteraceae bacterium]|nr:amidohydrolase family protein [Rhodanobacteraceae bacterium]
MARSKLRAGRGMTSAALAACLVVLFACTGAPGAAWGQAAPSTSVAPVHARYTGPIIDVHLHTDPPASAIGMPNPVTGTQPASDPADLLSATLRECEKYHIVRAVLNGWPGTLDRWMRADPTRFIAAPMILRDSATPTLDVASLRQQITHGKAGAIGEIIAQYVGLKPDDPVLEPYWRLAEELDAPVVIHMGTSFPGTVYAGYPAFRLSLGNPMLLEEVLVRHPKLRIWVAHAALPWRDEILALMQQYPQLYIDVSTIDWIDGPEGRPAFHAFLRQAIAQGFGKRIMFGSDQMAWPDAIGLAIDGVDSADFLTLEQKRDIFYANAVRFFRLKEPLVEP